MEIVLGSKRRLSFFIGLLKKDKAYEFKVEQQENLQQHGNNMAGWIRKFVTFLNFASHIWKYLETRFTQTNGAIKYKPDRDVYEIQQ